MSFSQKILHWYSENKRDLPWRHTTDPYKIWLSEIMLQQTRVAQGTPYYFSFLEHFPTVEDLANASEEKVLKLWQGLGYYSRARNLHATAKIISEKYKGEFPSNYKELLALKGVGDYTASAIASICFNLPEPVVDGNVYRVLARYFGIDTPINSTEGIAQFKTLAREVMDPTNMRDYNQGIMEFGAIQCAPQKPYCLHCPLNDSCASLSANKVHLLPVKLKKTKVRNRYFNYIIPIDDHKRTVLNQRKGKGIWQHLYEFPLVELEHIGNLKEVRSKIPEEFAMAAIDQIQLFNEDVVIHKLSHQHIHTQFWIVNTTNQIAKGIPISKLEDYPVPVLIADFIKAFKNSYF